MATEKVHGLSVTDEQDSLHVRFWMSRTWLWRLGGAVLFFTVLVRIGGRLVILWERLEFDVTTFASLLLPGALAWLGLAFMVNRTSVRVTGDRLKVRHWPFVFPGGTWARAELERLETALRLWQPQNRENPDLRYDLVAIRRDGKRQVVVRALASWDEAIWLHRALSLRLNLPLAAADAEAKVSSAASG